MRKPDVSIIGKSYNKLKVIALTDKRNTYNRSLYECECLLCGTHFFTARANIVKGDVKNCGCTRHYPRKENLVGTIVHNLLIKSTTVKNEHLHYVCDCMLCGNETVISHYDIKQIKSCGCLISRKAKTLYVDGTAPCKLNSDKLRKTNTTGVTGVYYDKSRNKWSAEITFKRKSHKLGRFDTKEEATKARKEAEEKYFKSFLENTAKKLF